MPSFAFIYFLLVLFKCSNGWMPGTDKQIMATDGTNLFSGDDTTSLPRDDSSVRSLPQKIRGVNLGSLFVFEPWMARAEWESMGCGTAESELGCVQQLGQRKANLAFQNHWNTWVTLDDIQNITSHGLNTVRIPVGFWLMESLVESNETFPQGGIQYLEQVCGWASDLGLFIILDLHGAPGAQVANNSETGQFVPTPGFYTSSQYSRAIQFLSWLTNLIYSNRSFRNVGVLSIVNEPLRKKTTTSSMINLYYPSAYAAIRAVEAQLQIPQSQSLHVQTMNSLWGSGDPTTNLSLSSPSTYNLAFDSHRYLLYNTSLPVTQTAYISDSCKNTLQSPSKSPTPSSVVEPPTIVGEFSLAVPSAVASTSAWSNATNLQFYQNWFAAQVTGYEQHSAGWVFWSWKTQLGDYRWDFQDAVAAGVIPEGLNVNTTICNAAPHYGVEIMWFFALSAGWGIWLCL